jgi:polyribonucleotide nucleotidyltransferase
MLDSGVPLKTHVAGVAMGLILGETSDEEPVILTDILGLEDALGTMDFKIAGNETGITTFQLDIKSEGLTPVTLQRALAQAKRGRLHILKHMRDALPGPRSLKDSIPKILSFMVPTEALGKVIGPKGATVTKLIETHKLVNINLDDSGLVQVRAPLPSLSHSFSLSRLSLLSLPLSSSLFLSNPFHPTPHLQVESFSQETNELVKGLILKIAEGAGEGKGGDRPRRGGGGSEEPKETGPPPEEGMVYRGCAVTGVQKFGVFVEILPGYEGLVHLSELDSKKVADPAGAGFAVGQTLDVKYLGKNEKGQMRLSRRAVLMRDTPMTASGASSALAEAAMAAVVPSPAPAPAPAN